MKLTIWILQNKYSQRENIPFKIITNNGDILANFILQNFNQCIIDGKFLDQLKKADVSSVFKRGNHKPGNQETGKISYCRFQKFMSVSFIWH